MKGSLASCPARCNAAVAAAVLGSRGTVEMGVGCADGGWAEDEIGLGVLFALGMVEDLIGWEGEDGCIDGGSRRDNAAFPLGLVD